MHLRDFVSRIVDQIETVCVCGAGHGLAELAIAIEFEHLRVTLTDISGNGYPNYHGTINLCRTSGIDQLSFAIWDVCEPAKARFDLVCSTEVLEHIRDAPLAAANMRDAARSYVYCLVPFADAKTNADPEKRRYVFEKFQRCVYGYDEASLTALFPDPVAVAGTYWADHGGVWRKKMESMTSAAIEASQNDLFDLAAGDLIDRVPQTMREAAGIKILARGSSPNQDARASAMPDTDQSSESCSELKELREGGFDFLDFGCSRGGSIGLAMRLFDAKRGLGIDIAENKVKEARSAGYDAIVCDIKELPSRPLVRFCVMSHFLEHVPSRTDVVAYLKKAIAISREFIFIRQPYFDADGFLFQRGLKLYWSDWHGHTNTMSTLDFYSILMPMLKAGTIGNFSIHVSGPIHSSDYPAVHPIRSPRDQHEYDPAKHPEKPKKVQFEERVFTEVGVLITKAGIGHYSAFGRVPFDRTIFDASADLGG